MPLRTRLTRLALAAAAGTLATTAVVTPAFADDWDGEGAGSSSFNEAAGRGDGGGNGGRDNDGRDNDSGRNDSRDNDSRDNDSGRNDSRDNDGRDNDWGSDGQGGNGQGGGGGWGQGGDGGGNGQGGDGDGWGSSGGNGSDWESGSGGNGGNGGNWGNHDDDQGDHLSRGVVTARGGLLLRSRPERGSRVIRRAAEGETVRIYCQTSGESVRGDSLWYLLTDGTWAWGAARYIDVHGHQPRWC